MIDPNQGYRVPPPTRVVTLYRSDPAYPDTRETATAAKKAVAFWLAKYNVTEIASFTEVADGGKARPVLGQALRTCRTNDAGLLLPPSSDVECTNGEQMLRWHESVVSGVRAVSISYGALPKPAPPEQTVQPPSAPLASPIALPESAPPTPSLYFSAQADMKLAVYLCNPGPHAMRDIVISSVGTTSQWTRTIKVDEGDSQRSLEVPIETSVSRRQIDIVSPGQCAAVERYDLLFDADFITIYEIAYTNGDSARCKSRVVIGKGGPTKTFNFLEAVSR